MKFKENDFFTVKKSTEQKDSSEIKVDDVVIGEDVKDEKMKEKKEIKEQKQEKKEEGEEEGKEEKKDDKKESTYETLTFTVIKDPDTD